VVLDAPAPRSAGPGDQETRPGEGGTPAPEGDRAPTLTAVSPGTKQTRVVSSNNSITTRLREIWRSRELLVSLVRTEIKVKYKNSVLGLLWSMLAPAMTLLVFTIVFGKLLKNGIPNFVIFLFSGLLIWNFFSTGVITATAVVVNNAGLVKKVAFPREILALAALGSAGVFFFFQALVMAIFMVVLRTPPAWGLLWLLLVALVPMMVFAAALGLLLGSINVYLRDTQHLVEVIVGAAWFWACPIVYSYWHTIHQGLKADHYTLTWLYLLNPMTPLVMTFQRVLYAQTGLVKLIPPHPHSPPSYELLLPPWGALTYVWMDALVLAFAAVLFVVGMSVFGRLAGNFAEEL
jgi:ABC-2 type transport system permease protein